MIKFEPGLIDPESYAGLQEGSEEATRAASRLVSQVDGLCLVTAYATDALLEEKLSGNDTYAVLDALSRLSWECHRSIRETNKLLS